MQASISKQIMIPMAVMLLLTVLVGFSMLQLIRPWENAVGNINRHFTEVVILNQIRSDLSVIEQDLAEQKLNQDALSRRWQLVSDKVSLLNRMSPENAFALPVMTVEPTQAFQNSVNVLLKRDFFKYKLQQTQAEMSDLLDYTRFVTTMLTISMVILGGVLMGVTANRLNRLIEQLSQSRDLNMRIQEEERRRIAQDLHDSVIQDMVDLKRDYQPEKADALIENVRRICHNLKPQVLHDLGLVSALEFLTEDLGSCESIKTVHLDTGSLDQLENVSKDLELSVFRVVQESFANIRRHARASEVWAKFDLQHQHGTKLLGEIKDNGQGTDISKHKLGMGLTGIRERIEQLGGSCQIESESGKGLTVRFSVPVDAQPF